MNADQFRDYFYDHMLTELYHSAFSVAQSSGKQINRRVKDKLISKYEAVELCFSTVNAYEWSEEIRYALSKALNETIETVAYEHLTGKIGEDTLDDMFHGSFSHGPRHYEVNANNEYEIYATYMPHGVENSIEVSMTFDQYKDDVKLQEIIDSVHEQADEIEEEYNRKEV